MSDQSPHHHYHHHNGRFIGLHQYEAETTSNPAEANTALSSDAITHTEQPPSLPKQRPSDSPINKDSESEEKKQNEDHERPSQMQNDYPSSSSDSSNDDNDPAPEQRTKRRGTFGLLKKKQKNKDSPTHSPQKTNSSFSPKSFDFTNSQLRAQGRVSKKDGRLNFSLNHTVKGGVVGQALTAALRNHVGSQNEDSAQEENENIDEGWERTQLFDERNWSMSPKLNIVIQVIGSRGDIQPFIKIAQILKKEHGHRVRVATHPAFRAFIEEDCGLEFFSIGGNPSELMAFMVKNPGLIPTMETVKEGEIQRRRDSMYEMFEGFWRSCINPTDNLPERKQDPNDPNLEPFIADAIIANPPSFAHVHCAERLGCPLHMIFTFPSTPTSQFPSPLTNLKQGDVDQGYTNFMSYPLVEMLTWQGLGDLVNKFREQILGLDPVSTIWAPSQLYRLHVPFTYCWSPSLVPKPPDWGKEIDIAGYVFLDLASSFEPPEDLAKFLDDGEPPIYIGFGSIVIDDPDKFTKLIFQAVDKAGVRAVVNKGWGGIGAGDTPKNVFMLENTPHDWLFPKCKAVVHHGGAGTVAIGLKCGKPTMIVPFFGDQPFWGSMLAKARAGAFECVRYKDLTVDKFAEGIKQCLTEEAQRNVQKIADSIAKEGDGAENAAKSFHAHLPWRGSNAMYCSILTTRSAVWRLKGSRLKLSPLAAELLVRSKKVQWKHLRLMRHYEWNDFQGPGETFTGTASGVTHAVTGIGKSLVSGPMAVGHDIHEHEKHKKKKKRGSSGRFSFGRHKKDKQDEADAEKEAHQKRDRGNPTDNALPENTQQSGQLQTEMESGRHGNDKTSSTSDDDESDTDEHNEATTADSDSDFGADVARHTAIGLVKPIQAIAEAPMHILLGLGNGLHNAPRLYGDTSVRKPRRITGFNSGMHAALEEFVYGTYDAFSGLVTQPMDGAKHNGAAGALVGVGKGVGGLVLKQSAALIAPLGMAMKGVQKEVGKVPGFGGHDTLREIREARIRQGVLEAEKITFQDKEKAVQQVEDGWRVMERLWDVAAEMKREGVQGRMRLEREKKVWEKYGVFESIGMCKAALAAVEQDVDLESYVAEARRRKVAQGEVAGSRGTGDVVDHAGKGDGEQEQRRGE